MIRFFILFILFLVLSPESIGQPIYSFSPNYLGQVSVVPQQTPLIPICSNPGSPLCINQWTHQAVPLSVIQNNQTHSKFFLPSFIPNRILPNNLSMEGWKKLFIPITRKRSKRYKRSNRSNRSNRREFYFQDTNVRLVETDENNNKTTTAGDVVYIDLEDIEQVPTPQDSRKDNPTQNEAVTEAKPKNNSSQEDISKAEANTQEDNPAQTRGLDPNPQKDISTAEANTQEDNPAQNPQKDISKAEANTQEDNPAQTRGLDPNPQKDISTAEANTQEDNPAQTRGLEKSLRPQLRPKNQSSKAEANTQEDNPAQTRGLEKSLRPQLRPKNQSSTAESNTQEDNPAQTRGLEKSLRPQLRPKNQSSTAESNTQEDNQTQTRGLKQSLRPQIRPKQRPKNQSSTAQNTQFQTKRDTQALPSKAGVIEIKKGCFRINKKEVQSEASFCFSCIRDNKENNRFKQLLTEEPLMKRLKSFLAEVTRDATNRIKGKLPEDIKYKDESTQICSPHKSLEKIKKNVIDTCNYSGGFEKFFKDTLCKSEKQGVPVELMMAMMSIESVGDCTVGKDDVGLWQINNPQHQCKPGFKAGTVENKDCLRKIPNNLNKSFEILKDFYKAGNGKNLKPPAKNWLDMSSEERNEFRRAVVGYNGGYGLLQHLKAAKDSNRKDLFSYKDDKSTWEEIRAFYFSHYLRPSSYSPKKRSLTLDSSNIAHVEAVLGREVKNSVPGIIEIWAQYKINFLKKNPVQCSI